MSYYWFLKNGQQEQEKNTVEKSWELCSSSLKEAIIMGQHPGSANVRELHNYSVNICLFNALCQFQRLLYGPMRHITGSQR